MNIQNKGIVWISDGNGQVFKGQLVDYDRSLAKFWVRTSHECPREADVVVILKGGELFPSGKPEWCGKACLVSTEKTSETPEGFFLNCLESRSDMNPSATGV